jgi:hypothetical protein
MHAFGRGFHGIFPLLITILHKLNINIACLKTALRILSVAELATDIDPVYYSI